MSQPNLPKPATAATVGYENAGKPVSTATLGYESAGQLAPRAVETAATIADVSPRGASPSIAADRSHAAELAATQAAESPTAKTAAPISVGLAQSLSPAISSAGRTTVLPRVVISDAGPQWGVDARPRYERVKTLGEGGMGEVALVEDRDIERRVAVKKLRSEVQGTTALLRFAEEIKVIGQLEHPNIIPIHDVGIDEQGQHYFVMKYVSGETLESVIDKLRAGEPAFKKRFTYEHRTQVFISVLQAIRYAHARGIIHRDIKPANIMVGPFGEVTVMDWGLAKKIRDADGSRMSDGKERETDRRGTTTPLPATTIDRKKLIETQHGALLGTPLYMSPEQAAGKIDQLDERSDIYSLGVMFHELITLEHYLADKESLGDVLAAAIDPNPAPTTDFFHIAQKGVPAELNWFLQKAVEKDPAKRFQTIEEMVDRLEGLLAGEFKAQCQVTWFKRQNHRFLKWIDRHQIGFVALMFTTIALLLFGAVSAVVALVRALT